MRPLRGAGRGAMNVCAAPRRRGGHRPELEPAEFLAVALFFFAAPAHSGKESRIHKLGARIRAINLLA